MCDGFGRDLQLNVINTTVKLEAVTMNNFAMGEACGAEGTKH